MKTSLEEISSVKKKILIEVESKEVDKKLNEAYRDLGRRAKIPGFRPGKIPRKILESRFGEQVADDVTRSLINDTLPQAIDESKTFPLGVPVLEKEALKQGQDFKYSALMEVRPQFSIDNYLGLEVEKEKFQLNEETVTDQIERIREGQGKLTAVDPPRPVRKDDFVVLDYEGFENDQPLEGIKTSNFLLRIGSNDFHHAFEEALIGFEKGDEKEISVAFEEDYYHSGLAGKSVSFKVKVTDIKEMVLPDLDDEFAKGLGADFEGLDALKEKVRENLTAQEEKRIDRELKQRLLEKIAGTVEFELPQTLVDSEINFAIENVKQNLLRGGSDFEKAGISEEKIGEEFRPASEKRVKDLLILGEIANKENMEVEDQDLEEGYANVAASMGQDTETIKKYYEARGLVDSFKEKLLEEKTLNYLVENAKILEVEKDNIPGNEPKKEDG